MEAEIINNKAPMNATQNIRLNKMKGITDNQIVSVTLLIEMKYSYLDSGMGRLYFIHGFTDQVSGIDFILVDRQGKKMVKYVLSGDIDNFIKEFKEDKIPSHVSQKLIPKQEPIPKRLPQAPTKDVFKYTHLYIGQEFIYESTAEKLRGTIYNVDKDGGFYGVGKSGGDDDYMEMWEWANWPDDEKVRLILLGTDELSKEQSKEYYIKCIKRSIPEGTLNVDTPESIRYLLGIGVDCFDLIEQGLAVRKKDADKMVYNNTFVNNLQDKT